MRIRSGLTVLALRIASSPLSLATTSYPALVSMSLSTCRSVGESSTIRIRLIAIASRPSMPPMPAPRSGPWAPHRLLLRRSLHMRRHGLQQALLGKRLGQVLIRANHAAACAVEQPVLRRQHHDGRLVKFGVFLDQRAGLVA